MTDRPHIPTPNVDGYPQPEPPDDITLDEHAEWLGSREPTPETCFYCWHLVRRGAAADRAQQIISKSPAWLCERCGYESFCGYFASSTVCPMCPDRPPMRRGWDG